MDKYDLLVVNGLVVTASDTAHYDIAIKDGKIALLAPQGSLSKEDAARVIDAEGGYVMVCRSRSGGLRFRLPLPFTDRALGLISHGFLLSLEASTAMYISKSLLYLEEKEEAVTRLRRVGVPHAPFKTCCSLSFPLPI